MPYLDIYSCLAKNPAELISFFSGGLVLDTNVLILYLVGLFDIRNNHNYLNGFKYDKKDYFTLTKFIELAKIKNFIVTPHILTEFYSLTKNKIKNKSWDAFVNSCSPFLLNFNEIYINKNEIIQHRKFRKFGFCDVGIKIIYEKRNCNAILTDDAPLHGSCIKSDMACIHFADVKNCFTQSK